MRYHIPDYPKTQKQEIVEELHGLPVPDPFRWLEEMESEEARKWVDAQNRITEAFLQDSENREEISRRLKALLNGTRYDLSGKGGQWLFIRKSEALENQPLLMRYSPEDARMEVLLNINELSEDGTVAVVGEIPSPDGRYLLCAVSEGGSDWIELRILDTYSKEMLHERLIGCRFLAGAWNGDSTGIIYSRYPLENHEQRQSKVSNNQLYYHKLGEPQQNDTLIFENPQDPELDFVPMVTDDGKYLVISGFKGTSEKNVVYYARMDSPHHIMPLFTLQDAAYRFIGNKDNTFYFITNKDADFGRIVSYHISEGENGALNTVIAEGEWVLDRAGITSSSIICLFLKDAANILQAYSLSGEPQSLCSFEENGQGSILQLITDQEEDDFVFSYSSYLHPVSIYKYSPQGDDFTCVLQTALDFDSGNFRVFNEYATSKDGTKVPLTLICRKDMKRNGKNRAMLYGYGGFGISLTPMFKASVALWLELGGVYAVAHLRGGSEGGEKWHQAGMLDKKQNVFDDFKACADHLVAGGYTVRDRLAIRGGSNGGLLVAACLVQWPEAFGAVICEVPVIDMLRYHLFTVGKYWLSEYGNPENPEHFKFIYPYSPLHHIKNRTYAPVLVLTGDGDDRVVPAHAHKFVATMQNTATAETLCLLLHHHGSGHGAGKPLDKIIHEESSIIAFLNRVLAS